MTTDVKVLMWSCGCNEWIFYKYFTNLHDFESHINCNGFDHRFFKIEG